MDQIREDRRTNGESAEDSWHQHEHLSAQLELDAVRLLADAGTPELAKFAIDSVEQQQHDHMRTEFAQAAGFGTYADLVAASAGIDTDDDGQWYVTLLPNGQWLAWNFFDVRSDLKHTTREAAVAHIEQIARVNLPR